jgi:hypothetical protein
LQDGYGATSDDSADTVEFKPFEKQAAKVPDESVCPEPESSAPLRLDFQNLCRQDSELEDNTVNNDFKTCNQEPSPMSVTNRAL